MANEPNRVDELMSLDPVHMVKDDIDAIIAYHRSNRAKADAGAKAAKEKPKVSIMAAGGLLDQMMKKPEQAPIARRKL